MFLPGEVRENARIIVASGDLDEPNLDEVDSADKAIPLAERVSHLSRDARLIGLRGLVVLQGADSEAVKKLTAEILDGEEVPDVLGFLPMVVNPRKVRSEAAMVREHGWRSPEKGEVVLIAIDGDEKLIGTDKIAASDLPNAIKLATAFVKQHAPPVRDAKARLRAAQDVAKRQGKRVWVVEGGPRCGPCLKLAKWMDEHHVLLEKDYVIVKILQGYDKSVEEVMALFNQPKGEGIPWMAITEPAGAVLATSDGPLGNIGFPGTIENLRHFREMLRRTTHNLTAQEQDQLAESLTQPEL
jgi:hypothetical protein